MKTEPQYKRHVAYCRRSQGRTRPRSCRACNQAKIKCNSGAPCHQCCRKRVACVYDQLQSRQRWGSVTSKGPEEGVASTVASDNFPVPVPVPATDIPATDTPINSALALSDLGAEELGLGLEHHDLPSQLDQVQQMAFDPSLGLSLFQCSIRNDEAAGIGWNGVSRRTSSLSLPVTRSPADIDRFVSLLQDTSNNTITNNTITSDIYFQLDNLNYHSGKGLQTSTFPAALSTTVTSPLLTSSLPSLSNIAITAVTSPTSDQILAGHFTKREAQTSIQQTYTKMIIDMIHAYPRMMIRRETFPPFVHAYLSPCDPKDNQNRLPESLMNCVGISQLFTARNEDTRSFVWATIRAEMRQFKNQISMFDKYDALSAIQAAFLYLIMRVVDDVPHDSKDDYEMIFIYEVGLAPSFLFTKNKNHVSTKSDNFFNTKICTDNMVAYQRPHQL